MTDKNEVAIIQKEVSPIVEKAQSLKIKSGKDMEKSVEFLSQLNKQRDALTDSKEKLTKPINQALKEIRDRYKPVERILDEAISFLRGEQSRYQTEQTKIAEAEAERIANRVGAGKGKLKAETASEKIAEIEKPKAKVNTTSGAVNFRKDAIVKVIDLSKIPQKYWNLDESRLLADLKAGLVVPGAEMDYKMTPVNSR